MGQPFAVGVKVTCPFVFGQNAFEPVREPFQAVAGGRTDRTELGNVDNAPHAKPSGRRGKKFLRNEAAPLPAVHMVSVLLRVLFYVPNPFEGRDFFENAVSEVLHPVAHLSPGIADERKRHLALWSRKSDGK